MMTTKQFHGIPTKHKGRQFRSRLEARWGTFFDLVGWQYEYEPFDCNGWIPDFALKRLCTRPILVEIKPVNSFPCDVAYKIVEAAPEHEMLILGYTIPLGENPEVPPYQLGWFYQHRLAMSPVHLLSAEERPLWNVEPGRDHGSRMFREWVTVDFGLWHKKNNHWGPDFLTSFGFCPRDEYCLNELHVGIGPEGPADPLVPGMVRELWTEAGNRTQWKPPR